MSFQEKNKTKKNKFPAKERSFTFHAFHPKAVNNKLYLAGLLACSIVESLPIPIVPEQ
jgi:hypothetical protein